jgi:KaiC/GvpD/RAD55 family RecA-like ATPase
LRGAAPDVVRGVIGAVVDALLGGGLVRVVSAGIEALTRRSLRQLLMKWGIVRNETVECLKNIVDTAKEVSQYIDDEELRDVVEEVAKKWGWDVDTFKRFVKTAAGKTVTESEVRRMIEEALEKIEEELGKVRESVRGRLAGVEVFFINDFEDGLAYPTVRLVNGELMVLGGYGYHEVVRTGSFGALASEVERRLGAGSLVVLTGPKGVGKSTLATVTIWELLRGGEVGMVLRIRELPDGEVVESFRSFIENFLVRDWEYFGNMIILYDPTGVYGQVGGVEAPSKLETTVKNILEAVRRAVENAKSILGREPSARVGVLIILPTDLYNALSNDVKGKLESYRLDVLLNDAEFLAKLIREYTRTKSNPNGCALSDRELSELAGKLAKFDSGHALIAKFAGEELARNNCNVGEVEKLIDNAKGKAEKFITQYINSLFKIHEDPKTAEALVEVFALRRPFVNITRPGDPILTPSIVKLIGEEKGASLLQSAEGEELRNWLTIRQHDLIEEAIKKLLDCIVSENKECKDLGNTLEPWKSIGVMESLRRVSKDVKDVDTAAEYFANYYGKRFTNTLRILSDISDNYWKKAALIIGYALAGPSLVLRLEDLLKGLPGDVIEFLDYASRRYEIDDFLLVDNEIPSLITSLVLNNAYVLTEAFVGKYKEAVNEINKILNKVRGRDKGIIYDAEAFYGLGLALIIANAAESGKPVESNDADAALYIVSFIIQHVVSPDLIPDLIVPILNTLWPLRGKAPQRYIELLALELLVLTSDIEILDLAMVRYILDELNEILDKYGDVVRGYVWSLVHAIRAYAYLLRGHREYFDDEEVEGAVRRVTDLLNELGRFKTSLGVIAWAYALAPALMHEDVRRLMEEALHIDVVDKASEILEELNDMRERVQELMGDKEFMSYIESMYIKTDEKAVKKVILETASHLKHALAIYRLYNDELDEAKKLSNEAAEEYREIGDYENYLIARDLALRAEAIKGSLVGDDLVKKFQRLYEETFKEEYFMPTALYLSFAPGILGDYLVSLALTGDDKKINELLEEHWLVLRINEQVSVLTRLTLNALLGHRVELSGELKDKLGINSWELINAFGSDIYMYIEFLPALRVALGIAKPKDETAVCMLIKDSTKEGTCMYAISAAMNDNAAVVQLRGWLINRFQGLLFEKLGLLKELGANADALLNEFRGLVDGLDGKSLVQLIAPGNSMAQFVLMLHALVNGNEKLAKAHALMGTTDLIRESEFISWFWFTSMIISKSKLLTRLFLEAYGACCDLGSEEFKRAVAKLFFLHA